MENHSLKFQMGDLQQLYTTAMAMLDGMYHFQSISARPCIKSQLVRVNSNCKHVNC